MKMRRRYMEKDIQKAIDEMMRNLQKLKSTQQVEK